MNLPQIKPHGSLLRGTLPFTNYTTIVSDAVVNLRPLNLLKPNLSCGHDSKDVMINLN